MTEYLKRDDVLSKADILTVHTREYGSIEVVPVEYIADLPIADVIEVKCSEQKEQQFVGRTGFFSIKDFTCNECGENFEVGQGKGLMHFCPNCGAKNKNERITK